MRFFELIAGVLSAAIERSAVERALRHSERELSELNESLELRVHQRTAELEETNAELEAFAYSVSHDLRTPLRAMEGFASALAEDYGEQLDDNGRLYIHQIAEAASRMDVLVDDLLAYSRLGRTELRLQPVELQSVVDQVLLQLEPERQERGARIEIAENLPRVLGQRAILQLVFSNLLSNAMKFVAHGVQPEIRLWSESRPDGKVRIWCEDNGIGIDRAHTDGIFDVFARLHGIESYPGTGIGLAIVRRASERLGGGCGVESQPGLGSRFWVELPEARRVGK